jgi:hypothetical protein
LLAACTLLAIAMVHSDDRLASAITMALFASGVAASSLLVLAHDRPFIGELLVGPAPLFQVIPSPESSQQAMQRSSVSQEPLDPDVRETHQPISARGVERIICAIRTSVPDPTGDITLFSNLGSLTRSSELHAAKTV